MAGLAQPPVTACAGSSYSYGSGACAPCPAGAAFISSSRGCAPAVAPTDTAFYLSGSSAEGAAAFTTIQVPSGITYSAGPFGAANGALTLASGSYLAATGSSAPPSLPAGGNVAWTASAWVKCAASSTWAGVLEWGANGDAGGFAGLANGSATFGSAATLDVASLAPGPYSGLATTIAENGADMSPPSFGFPTDVAINPSSGAIVVTEAYYNRILLVSKSGQVSTIAGNGGPYVCNFSDGVGTSASICHPYGVAVNPSSGVIVVADTGNNRIRIISQDGHVSTIAGHGGLCAFADGQGTSASFCDPRGVAVISSSGAIVVADQGNHRIRLISQNGLVKTLAGSGNQGSDDGLGTAASFRYPFGVAVIPSSGAIAVADTGNNRIRLLSQSGYVTTLAGSGDCGSADGQGLAASFCNMQIVAVIPFCGVIVVADRFNHRIRLISQAGLVTTLAGSGDGFADGLGAAASFSYPSGVAVTPSGAIVVVDQGNLRIRLVTPQFSGLPACDSTWHHVSLTYAPSGSPYTLSAFLDGALIFASATTITLPPASASSLRVGWSGDLATNGGSLFAGALSDLRIYSRALAASEVAGLAQPPVTACAGSSYSYGSGACAPCPAGAAFISSSRGCAPAVAPTDTAFYLSGSAAEGDAAFPSVQVPAGVTYTTGPFGAAPTYAFAANFSWTGRYS